MSTTAAKRAAAPALKPADCAAWVKAVNWSFVAAERLVETALSTITTPVTHTIETKTPATKAGVLVVYSTCCVRGLKINGGGQNLHSHPTHLTRVSLVIEFH